MSRFDASSPMMLLGSVPFSSKRERDQKLFHILEQAGGEQARRKSKSPAPVREPG